MSSLDSVPANASSVASISRSSAERSHRSPNALQPMPTIATWSAIPLLANDFRLPEVVVHAVRGVQPAEDRLNPHTDRDLLRIRVGQLERVPPAAVEIDDR